MKGHFSWVDNFLMHVDLARKTLCVHPTTHQRDYPANHMIDSVLSETEKKHVAGLMRVNHAGEVCAQALYQGQELTARCAGIKQKMQQASEEELDHLAWCNQRLDELNSHASYFNFIWYCAALNLGIVAGLIGDRWSLGFLAETEQQVVQHLEAHLAALPQQDDKTRVIIEQMRQDEAQHRDMAQAAGAAVLPKMIKQLMQMSSSIMIKVAYYF
jgi:ubiquinone biosynthesis monooxygenase Coq7